MKSLIYIFSFAILTGLTAAFNLPVDEKGDILLTCNVNSCDKVDSLFLFDFNGISFKKIKAAPTTDWQTYQFKMPVTGPRFYYVGLANYNLRPVILGSEEKVGLNGSCPSFQGALISGSDINEDYEAVKNEINLHKNELGTYLRQLQAAQAQGNVEVSNMITLKLAELDKKRLNLVDSLKKVSPYLAKVAAINTYLSYQNNGKGGESEIEYFARNFFQYADWKDPDYNHLPWVYEGLKSYAQTLASVGLPESLQKQYSDNILALIPKDSRTYMLALGGIIAGYQSKNNSNMGPYASLFVEKYKKTEPEAVAQVQTILQMSASFITGGAAPDFTMNTPDDKPMSLKDFKGKILLIDFWASWCGPCRRENPHVVALYNKYHGKGFEILGVSLDKTKEPWLAAIEKDGLIWNHVSDLNSRQNAAAQLYGVTSIPHTVLVDKEGKILARNLRGPALEAKLAEILGE